MDALPGSSAVKYSFLKIHQEFDDTQYEMKIKNEFLFFLSKWAIAGIAIYGAMKDFDFFKIGRKHNGNQNTWTQHILQHERIYMILNLIVNFSPRNVKERRCAPRL